MLKRVILAGILFALSGCKPAKDAVNAYWNAGTVEGASQCVASTSDELLSEPASKRACIAKFERRLAWDVIENLDGRGSPQSRVDESVFSGGLTNRNSEFVFTKLVLRLRFVGPEVDDVAFHNAEVVGWFEPGNSPVQFVSASIVDAPEDWSEVDACDEADSVNCWSWVIDAAWGLEIK